METCSSSSSFYFFQAFIRGYDGMSTLYSSRRGDLERERRKRTTEGRRDNDDDDGRVNLLLPLTGDSFLSFRVTICASLY